MTILGPIVFLAIVLVPLILAGALLRAYRRRPHENSRRGTARYDDSPSSASFMAYSSSSSLVSDQGNDSSPEAFEGGGGESGGGGASGSWGDSSDSGGSDSGSSDSGGGDSGGSDSGSGGE